MKSTASGTASQDTSETIDAAPFGASNPSTPDAPPPKPKCDHLWDILPTVSGRPPKYEHCLLCRERRLLPKPKAKVFIPPAGCSRTGY